MVVVAVINIILEDVVNVCSSVERHSSSSNKLTSKTMKLFLATFFNTGMQRSQMHITHPYQHQSGNIQLIVFAYRTYVCWRIGLLVVLINANLNGFDTEAALSMTSFFANLPYPIEVFQGAYSDMDYSWYLTVGIAILTQG